MSLAEGLRRALKATETENKIKGLHSFGSNLPLSHQQYVDDTMNMGNLTVYEARGFIHILDKFAQYLGMKINKIKSQVYFLILNSLFRDI